MAAVVPFCDGCKKVDIRTPAVLPLKEEYVREVLSVYAKRLAAWLLGFALMALVSFAAGGRAGLIGAWLIGYAAAAVCLWNLIWRTWRSTTLTVERAKREMRLGFFLRLGTIFFVFWAAVQISTEVFFTVVSGFAVCYVVTMLHIMLLALRGTDKEKAD